MTHPPRAKWYRCQCGAAALGRLGALRQGFVVGYLREGARIVICPKCNQTKEGDHVRAIYSEAAAVYR